MTPAIFSVASSIMVVTGLLVARGLVIVPIDGLVVTCLETNIAKNSLKPRSHGIVVGTRVDDCDSERSTLCMTLPRDVCKLKLCQRVEVRHREADYKCPICLIKSSH